MRAKISICPPWLSRLFIFNFILYCTDKYWDCFDSGLIFRLFDACFEELKGSVENVREIWFLIVFFHRCYQILHDRPFQDQMKILLSPIRRTVLFDLHIMLQEF